MDRYLLIFFRHVKAIQIDFKRHWRIKNNSLSELTIKILIFRRIFKIYWFVYNVARYFVVGEIKIMLMPIWMRKIIICFFLLDILFPGSNNIMLFLLNYILILNYEFNFFAIFLCFILTDNFSCLKCDFYLYLPTRPSHFPPKFMSSAIDCVNALRGKRTL